MKEWEQFVQELITEFGASTIRQWVAPAELTKFDAGNVYLKAVDSFQELWLKEHLIPRAKKQLFSSNGRPIKIHIERVSKEPAKEPIDSVKQDTPEYQSEPLEIFSVLENYVPGNSNIIPYQILCKMVGFNPETYSLEKTQVSLGSYNPIYLYGKHGSGKSHLLMALAKTLRSKALKVFYIKAKTFMQHVVNAIRKGDLEAFRKTYRNLDVLIIDDVHKLSQKYATQEELFHTFNALHTAQKQMIFSSNVAPRYLEDIEDRLVSRFEWGIALPLETLNNRGDLGQVLKQRTKFYSLPLSSDIIEYLLAAFPSAHTLSEAIDTLSLKHRMKNKLPYHEQTELNAIKKSLSRLIDAQKNRALSYETIMKTVAEGFGVRLDDITGKSQARECVLPRKIAMFVLRRELKMPYMKIGKIFSRDHSTVMSSIKSIQHSIDSQDALIEQHLDSIKRQLVTG